jgi:hypothetical protein
MKKLTSFVAQKSFLPLKVEHRSNVFSALYPATNPAAGGLPRESWPLATTQEDTVPKEVTVERTVQVGR